MMKLINSIKFILTIYIFSFSSSIIANEASPLLLGEASNLSDDKITISLEFLHDLETNPSKNEWFKNYWELIYLINLGDVQATSVGIKVLATMPPRDRRYDHDGLKTLARALSLREAFWKLLSAQDPETIEKVINYYDKNPMDYTGEGAYEWQKEDYLKEYLEAHKL